MVWVSLLRKERWEMVNFQIRAVFAVQAPMGIGSNFAVQDLQS
jgi:hypothetical protein